MTSNFDAQCNRIVRVHVHRWSHSLLQSADWPCQCLIVTSHFYSLVLCSADNFSINRCPTMVLVHGRLLNRIVHLYLHEKEIENNKKGLNEKRSSYLVACLWRLRLLLCLVFCMRLSFFLYDLSFGPFSLFCLFLRVFSFLVYSPWFFQTVGDTLSVACLLSYLHYMFATSSVLRTNNPSAFFFPFIIGR